jgi:hypothetical protein
MYKSRADQCNTCSGVVRRTAYLREQRAFLLKLLDGVCHQSLHGFGTALVELTKVRGQVASADHEDDLGGGQTVVTEHTRACMRVFKWKTFDRVFAYVYWAIIWWIKT